MRIDHPVYLGGIATWVPAYCHAQSYVRDELLSVISNRRMRRPMETKFLARRMETIMEARQCG